MSSEDEKKVWETAIREVPLRPREVHVWRVRLCQPEPVIRRLRTFLSHDESLRAERFRFKRDRNSFVITRGALRTILSSYLDVEPNELVFAYGPKGKPRLAFMRKNYRLNFNVSHSHELALVAIANGLEVGIDIERIREDFATDQIATQFFSSQELSSFRNVTGGKRAEFFFDCWTRKEAYIKAEGQGLSIPLNSFSVAFSSGESIQLQHGNDIDCRETICWELFELLPGPEYKAALAVQRGASALRYLEWIFPMASRLSSV